MNPSLAHRLLAKLAAAHARSLLGRFRRSIARADRVQERLLFARLQSHQSSQFGIEQGFRSIRTYDDFVRQVPIRNFEGFRPYVDEMIHGNERALLGHGHRVLMFAMSSGSEDKPKLIPVTGDFLRDYRRGWNIFGIAALRDHPNAWLRGLLQVTSLMDEHRTERGVPCGAISGLLAATQKRLVRKYYVCPAATARIVDADARYYTIMRLAMPRDVAWMVTASPATQVRLARVGSTWAAQIIRDIFDGTLNPPGDLPSLVRSDLAALIRPDPEGAKRLESILEKHGELLSKHYWDLSFLGNWTGGSMGLHLRDFLRFFGNAPVRDIGLLATEGRVSIPFEDGKPVGVLDVLGSFFEFMEIAADGGETGRVLRCHELTPGGEYRVVMSTANGMFRYDLGDHVRVHGFVGRAPTVEFLHRGAFVSSLTGEKLTESQVMLAYDRATRATRAPLASFVLAPAWDDPPYYRLFVDSGATKSRTASVQERASAPDGVSNQSSVSSDQARAFIATTLRMDDELRTVNSEYDSKRKSGRLGVIRLITLHDGALARRDARLAARRGSANEQFKHRYLLSRPGDDEELIVEVATTEASTATA